MTSNESVAMLMQWKGQRRPVAIKMNDDIKTIERSIASAYQLRKIGHISKHQIQFYSMDYQALIDLCPDTLPLFQQLLLRLTSPEAPPKSDKTWIVDIISKTVEPLGQQLDALIADDTYHYQQDNDFPDSPINEETSSTAHYQSNGSRSHFLRSNSGRNSTTAFSESISHHNLDNDRLQRSASEHPLDLNFGNLLAVRQRAQFESDISRRTSSKLFNGGVLLRAAPKVNAASTDNSPYPVVHFRIPDDQLGHAWFMYIYILTESGQDGAHYLHASKGIFNRKKTLHGTSSAQGTTLDNPYIDRLSQDDIRDGKYELYIKVCNICGVSSRRREQLRRFPCLQDTISSTTDAVLSTRTSQDLKFSNEKYHVGCILVCQNQARASCVSSLTTATRKHNDTDKASEEGHESAKKKQRSA